MKLILSALVVAAGLGLGATSQAAPLSSSLSFGSEATPAPIVEAQARRVRRRMIRRQVRREMRRDMRRRAVRRAIRRAVR